MNDTERKMTDYLTVTYKNKPFTRYPAQLAEYIVNRFDIKPGDKLLDAGCGRGEYLKGFLDMGVDAYGNDMSRACLDYYPELEDRFKENHFDAGWGWGDKSFDFVFMKSVLEHLSEPDFILKEWIQEETLKPNGQVIILTPEFRGLGFFHDYTHRTPFVMQSLRDILEVTGFTDIHVERFYQAPVIWKAPWLKYIMVPVARMIPDWIRKISKSFLFSAWPMLLGTGRKI